jgi:hypothetical protein
MMMKSTLRIYVDTSVFGGVYDKEFAEFSHKFFEGVRRGDFVVLISSQVFTELMMAPKRVQDVLNQLSLKMVEQIEETDEIQFLAEAYIAAGVLGEGSKADAFHVAAATVAEADLIVSWNFTHIVRFDRIRMFNGVNVLNGYRPLDIRSPMEMAYDDQKEG